MNIPRVSLISELDAFCRTGNGLLVGDPGIGKTWALVQLERFARRRGVNVEMIGIASIYAEDESELKAYLGLQEDFVNVLAKRLTRDGRKGLLIFDGFDAARSDRKRNLFLRILRRCIAEAQNRWTVIVSVRSFDARKSRELTELFRVRALRVPGWPARCPSRP